MTTVAAPVGGDVGTLAHDRHGEGPPVVLVHGLGSRRGVWEPVAKRLAAEREVIAVDLPGFGESPPDGTEPSAEELATRLEHFFDELGLDRPHVAGNSLGGGVGLELGRRGAVASVTAFAPIGFWGDAGRWWSRAILGAGVRVGRASPKAGPDWLRAAVARPALFLYAYGKPWRAPDEEVLATADSGIEAPNFDRALEVSSAYEFGDPGLLPEVPVTIAWGTRDVLLTFATQSRRARRLAPWARHVTLGGCGHVPFFDDPARCAEIVRQTTAG